MNDNEIKYLLDAFYEGNASDQELKKLNDFFNSDNVPEYWRNEQKVFKAINLYTEIPMPENINKRLDLHIDNLARIEKHKKTNKIVYSIITVAAVMLLMIGIFIKPAEEPQIADTYTDPKEAAIAAEKALTFMSQQLNKGLKETEIIEQEINKINNILKIK